MANNLEKKIFIHQNLNKQELRQAVIENKTYKVKPMPNPGEDIGLLYYDTILDRILVWNGVEWKITQFLDDRDLNYGGDVFIEDIWTQTNLIPSNNPQSSPVLEYKSGLTMSHIPNTYSFESQAFEIDNVVPSYKYGEVYEPVLHDVNGATISTDDVNWKLEKGLVTIYSGFSYSNYLVDESNPPTLSYWRYIGDKGNLGSGGTSSVTNTVIIKIDSSNTSWVPPYNEVPFAYTINASDIVSITVNGVLVYDYSYSSLTQIITLNETDLDYTIDNIDIIRVEIVI
jgi:hypothetical protein